MVYPFKSLCSTLPRGRPDVKRGQSVYLVWDGPGGPGITDPIQNQDNAIQNLAACDASALGPYKRRRPLFIGGSMKLYLQIQDYKDSHPTGRPRRS